MLLDIDFAKLRYISLLITMPFYHLQTENRTLNSH